MIKKGKHRDYDFDQLRQVPKNSIFRVVFSRLFLCFILIVLQFLFIAAVAIIWGRSNPMALYISTICLCTVAFIFILNSENNPTYKLVWAVIIALLPVFGILLYLVSRFNIGSVTSTRLIRQSIEETKKYTSTDPGTSDDLLLRSKRVSSLSEYIETTGGYATYQNTSVKYFPFGEDSFAEIVAQLKKAEHFIFIEFFIIREGIFWDTILDILTQKVKEGVEVRVMYDDVGCMTTLSRKYPDVLQKLGIKVHVFARLAPLFSTHYNNRDHRKIIVIDGQTAFSGGINLADEYINEVRRFGRWKDNCFMLQGDAVRNYTLMFLQLWNLPIPPAARVYEPYLNVKTTHTPRPGDGFVIPYGDGPHQRKAVAQNVYLSVINSAADYIHIMTPYFVPDDELLNAIKRASRSGIEVRILLPHIPDKKSVNLLSKSYYPELIAAGVHIYEYTPGFIHSKVVEADGNIAVAGTINFDFRSLYLHYECASVIYENDVLKDINDDFRYTFAESERILMTDYKKINFLKRFAGRLLRMLAPLV